MRIVLITPWFPTNARPSSGLFVWRDALALAERHDVRVLHLDWNDDTATLPDVLASGIDASRVQLSRINPAAYGQARSFVEEATRGADVVHTHALPVLVPFANRRPAPAGASWVHTEHWSGVATDDRLPLAQRAMRRLLLPQLGRPDVVVVAAQRLADAVRQFRTSRVDIVPNVVPSGGPLVEAPRDPGRLRLAGVGGLIAGKDPLMALATVGALRDKGVTADLTWVGDGPLRQPMMTAAERAGLTERLTLAGTLPTSAVYQTLDDADMFLLPTLTDFFCVSVAEALTRGRPIVSGANTGARDYAGAQVAEFVATQSPQAYADAVIALRERTKTMTAADIAATVEGKFTPEAVAARLTEVYESLRA